MGQWSDQWKGPMVGPPTKIIFFKINNRPGKSFTMDPKIHRAFYDEGINPHGIVTIKVDLDGSAGCQVLFLSPIE